MVQVSYAAVDCSGYTVLNSSSWDLPAGKKAIPDQWGFLICTPASSAKKMEGIPNMAPLYGALGQTQNESIQESCYGIELEESDPTKALSYFSLACGLSIIEKAALEIGDTVAVAGANILALKIIEAAVLQGAHTVCLIPDAKDDAVHLPAIQKTAGQVVRFQLNSLFDAEFESLIKSTLGRTIYIDAVGSPTLVNYMTTRLKMFEELILCCRSSTSYFPLDVYRDIHRKSVQIHYWNGFEGPFDGKRMIDLCKRAEKLYEFNRAPEFV